MTTLPHLLTGLTPREAITDAIHRCIQGFDLNDRALFQSAIHPSATFDMNGNIFNGMDEIAKFYEYTAALDTTHTLSSIRIDLKPNDTTARVTCTNIAQHFRNGDGMKFEQGTNFWGGANYQMEIVREAAEEWDGLWKVKYWKLTGVWGKGDVGIVMPSQKEEA